jgi:hypothetical protein
VTYSTYPKGSYQMACKFCGASCIVWDDIGIYFADPDGKRHNCPPSSKVDQSRILNQTINDLKHEIDSKFDSLREDINDQNTATQKAVVGLRAEINNIHTLFKNHTGGYS